MELFEYIKSQLPQMPNSAIMKQLGASQELIDYVKETPENTNLNVMGSITNSGGGYDSDVWFVGNTGVEEFGEMVFALSNTGTSDHITELVTNGENYRVFLNGVELPDFVRGGEDNYSEIFWYDDQEPSRTTKEVSVYKDATETTARAIYWEPSTAPTSVEVSVKTK